MLFNFQKIYIFYLHYFTIYKFFNDQYFTAERLWLRGLRWCYQSEKTSKRKQKVQNIDIDVLVLKRQSDWWMAQDSQIQNSVNKRGRFFLFKKIYYYGSTSLGKKQMWMPLALPTTKPAIFTSSCQNYFQTEWPDYFLSTSTVQPGQGQDRHDNRMAAYSGILVIGNTSER